MKEQIALIALSRLRGVNNILKKYIIDTADSVAAFFEGKSSVFDDDMRMKALSFKDWRRIEDDLTQLDK